MKLFGIGCIAFATGTCRRIVRFVYSNNPAVTNVTSIYIVRGIVKNRRKSKRWESLLRKEIPNPSVRRPVFVSGWAASFCQNCCLNSPKRECRRDRQLLPGEPRPGPTERSARGRDSIGRSMSVIVRLRQFGPGCPPFVASPGLNGAQCAKCENRKASIADH